jgi:CRISPR-associated protein Cas2
MARGPAHVRIWIVGYDVSDNRRRRRLARLLEGEARRIQKSVFCTECTQDNMDSLMRRARREIAAGDRLLAYPVLQRAGLPLPWAHTLKAQRLPAYWIV